MKKNLLRLVAATLALCTMMGMAACGSKDAGTTDGTTTTGDTASTGGDAASGEVVTLKWVSVGNGQPSNYDAWLEQINPYLEEKIGVNLDVQVVSWGDWDNRRSVIVNTAGEYDILFTNMNTYVNDITIGAFKDITELVQTATPDLYASIPEDYWEACEVGGKLYAVPSYKDSSITEYLVPPTVGGLCEHLKIHRSTWAEYCDPEIHPEFSDTTTRARGRMREYLEQQLLTRPGKDIKGVIFSLENNYGYQDRHSIDVTGGGIEAYLQKLEEEGKGAQEF